MIFPISNLVPARWRAADALAALLLLGACSGAAPVNPVGGSGSLDLVVTHLPSGIGAAITLSGPGGVPRALTGSVTIAELPPGHYTLTAAPVTDDTFTYSPTPLSQGADVVAAHTTSVQVDYAATTGVLAVGANGLPSGASGEVVITGPVSFSRSITTGATVSALLPGSYTLTAANVVVGSAPYTPVLRSQVVTVSAGVRLNASITYVAGSPFGNLSPGFQARTTTVQGTSYGYQIFVPQGYSPSRQWPVILFGHGSGESGTNNTSQIGVGLGNYVSANASTFPAVVVFPQVPPISPAYPMADSIMLAAFEQTLNEVNADPTRLYLTGISAGGFRVWDIAMAAPGRFAALVPIAAGICATCINHGNAIGNSEAYALAAATLKPMPIRTFHGGADGTQAVQPDRDIAAAFAGVGSVSFTYTEFSGLGHGIWDQVYADPALWTWLFSQHR